MRRQTVTIRDFMTPDPCAVDEGLTVADAIDRMAANNIRHLLVLRGQRLVGVVGHGDLLMAAEVRGRDAPVSAATRHAHLCDPDESIEGVVRQMERTHRESAVAVRGGIVAGIFTITDALRALRQLVVGEEVQPEVVPTHVPELPADREQVLPNVRVKRLLRERGAVPSPNDGRVLGSVF